MVQRSIAKKGYVASAALALVIEYARAVVPVVNHWMRDILHRVTSQARCSDILPIARSLRVRAQANAIISIELIGSQTVLRMANDIIVHYIVRAGEQGPWFERSIQWTANPDAPT
jgi:hypothetical protein